ncbi:prepilin-type N-terminal cleavage/methylation domain-containing protein [Caulobacter sp. LARHSG274]
MSDDGYTLAEMLAALTILGLAMGGLGLVVGLISRQQLTSNRIQARLAADRTVDQTLTRWLAQDGAETLHGDARGLSFACAAATCAASLQVEGRRMLLVLRNGSGRARRLRLSDPAVRFSYRDARSLVDAWPPAETSPSHPGDQTPRAVLLAKPGAVAPLAVVPISPREPRDCQFDAIIGGCRIVTP